MSTLYRWLRVHRTGGLAALALDGRGKPRGGGWSGEALGLFMSLRHDARRFSISQAWRMVAAEAERHGWRWFATAGACRAWDHRSRDTRALILNQAGEQAFTARAAPYTESDPDSFEPGECFEADHSTLNFWARMKSGEVVRPVLTAWLDWRSRALVGWELVVTGNQDTILLALRNGARDYGLPSKAVVDNGRDFSAFTWTGGKPKRRRMGNRSAEDVKAHFEGVFRLLDIKPRWTLPYGPNSKARVERFFGTLDGQFSKNFSSYCGNAPANRPAAHRELVAQARPFQELDARLREWVHAYNNRPHSGEGMDGRTPLQVLATAPRKRVLTDEAALLLLAVWPRPVKIGRQGVSIRFCGTTLRCRAHDPRIQRRPLGELVRISYDRSDLSAVHVSDADFRYICRASENHRFNRRFATEELRAVLRERNRQKRALREVRKNGLKHLLDPVALALAAQRLDSATRRKPDPPGPEGGPILVPVQTPVEMPKPMKKVVGGPEEDIYTQTARDFEELCARYRAERLALEALPPTWPQGAGPEYERARR